MRAKASGNKGRDGGAKTTFPPRHLYSSHDPEQSEKAALLLQIQRAHGNRYLRSLLQTKLAQRKGGFGPSQSVDSELGRDVGQAPTQINSTDQANAPVPRKSEVVGGLVGAGIGAAAGAGLGFLIGGGVGALVGGLIGAVAGGIIGALAGRSSLTGPITDATVQAAMRQAWADSDAGSAANRHEEGGYIVRRADGSLGVERWPRGAGASIAPPARGADGRFNGLEVLGEFHTHPNPPVDEAGRSWVPGPSPGDITGITAEGYPGDSYVISRDSIFRVQRDGTVDTLGGRRDIIGE